MSIKVNSQVRIVGNSSFTGRIGKVIEVEVDRESHLFPYKVAFPRYKDNAPCIFEKKELKEINFKRNKK
jgi:hypothetical protein